MAENLIQWFPVAAALLSAIAALLAWCTARAALRVAQETERSAAEEKFFSAQKRYQLIVARLRMKASALIASANEDPDWGQIHREWKFGVITNNSGSKRS
jgi:hypothetical protein